MLERLKALFLKPNTQENSSSAVNTSAALGRVVLNTEAKQPGQPDLGQQKLSNLKVHRSTNPSTGVQIIPKIKALKQKINSSTK